MHDCAHPAYAGRHAGRGGGLDLLARERGDELLDRRLLRHRRRTGDVSSSASSGGSSTAARLVDEQRAEPYDHDDPRYVALHASTATTPTGQSFSSRTPACAGRSGRADASRPGATQLDGPRLLPELGVVLGEGGRPVAGTAGKYAEAKDGGTP